ncbi:MAG: PQQ-like beta-propeller repeat protein [Planctomycetes bacterium]|nr:PQQ-like beta-propeller repeat protein [Planctomycetota bacterium]
MNGNRICGGAAWMLAGMLACSLCDASDWPQWRGPNRDGTSPEKDWSANWPKEGPKQLWKANVVIGCSSVAVCNGRVFTMGNIKESLPVDANAEKSAAPAEAKTGAPAADPKKPDAAKPAFLEKDVVWCLNADTGEVLWKYVYDCPCAATGFEGGPCSTPCVDGENVYAQGKTGVVFCFEAKTGKIVWQHTPAKLGNTIWGGVAASPLVLGNLVICGNEAFEKATGKSVWQVKGGCHWSSPVPTTSGGKPAIAFFGGSLSLVDAADGKELAAFAWGSDQNVADPILFDDKVFISSRRLKTPDEQCALLKLGSGQPEVVWKNGKLPSYFQVRVKVGDCVYGCDETALKCVNLATGELKWEQKGITRGQPIASDGKLIVSLSGALLVAEASPAGFKQLARAPFSVGGTPVPPALTNGKLYCRAAKGDLVCLDVSGK